MNPENCILIVALLLIAAAMMGKVMQAAPAGNEDETGFHLEEPDDSEYGAGWLAYRTNKAVSSNPYPYNSKMWQAWRDGWHAARDSAL